MSMAHGLEVRSPFLDTELLAFATRLPPRAQGPRAVAQARAQGGGGRPAARRDPAAGRKRGFGVPLDRWFREDLRDLRRQHARRARRPRDGSTSSAAPSTACSPSTTRGARNHGHALWTLLTLEVFLRREGW